MSKVDILKVWRSFLDLLFPCECQICQGPLGATKWVCKECLSKIKFIKPPYCYRCGSLLAPFFLEVKEPICKECKKEPRYFHQARAVALYEGVVKECLHLFKYGRKRALYKPLGELLANFITTHWRTEVFDLITPVPLHPKRRRERGFNQAELLASPIKTLLKIPISKDLIRHRPTQTQTDLDKRARFENVKDAFRVKIPNPFRNKNILLIDDVFTTGATLNECSRTLKEAGAREVYALTLARVIG